MLKIDKEKLVSAVKPYGQTDKYADSIFRFKMAPENVNGCIELADKALCEEIPLLKLSDYREIEKNGNRSNFEKKYFKRRTILLELTAGEIASGYKGKHLEKAMNVLWSILEETTWVVPAHRQPENYPECKWVDIFSAATGGVVAAAYFFLKEEIKKEMPEGFCERVLYELRRRVTEPFMSDFSPFHCWKGTEGWYVNNWNPWIVNNTLTVAVLAEEDIEIRRKVAAFSANYLNRYLNFCFEDGSCVEGVSYFFKANASFFDIAELYSELTNGEYNIMDEPYVKKLMEYLPNMYAGNKRYFTMSDCGSSKETMNSDVVRFLKRMAKRLNSKTIAALVYDAGDEKKFTCGDHTAAYRSIRDLSVSDKTADNGGALTEIYMDSVQIMTLRRCDCTAFFKGGNNNEPHGHNDCGEFQIYYKGEPLFIDPGVEVYTAASFSENRQWCYSSLYHNTPVLNGTEQVAGYQGSPDIRYAATEVKADLAIGRMEMELSRAYPEEAKIKSAKRIMQLNGGVFTVSDSYCFEQSGRYEFHLMTTAKPQLSSGKMSLQIGGDIVKCRFNPDYEICVEEIPVNDERISKMWSQNVLYCTKIYAFKQSDAFSFTVDLYNT